MKKLTSGAIAAAMLASSFAFGALAASAQTTTSTGQTPVLYNQGGQPVNSSGSSEPAGYYYNSSGQQIYYYGNGTYYNPSTGTYGGTAFSTTSNGTSVTNTGTAGAGETPLLYNQGGQVANPGGTAEPAGYYYNASGQQIYYYGNGTYYDPSTGTYGGQAFGTSASSAASPGVPNTGAGGEAAYTWLALLVSAAIALGGVAYLSRRSSITA